ncbi:hypothetical protein FCM30_18400 [Lelliottia aquatilis]|uniref:hypothetical protein n=1 Tax=Enterobacteriaceae TaxID=543 RepID=UPI0015777A8A|nr:MULTISPECIES: hypothetical protein [Enterobacteriaceae]NTZ47713.1 hypothetical protein [Lelliottia aquatilis]
MLSQTITINDFCDLLEDEELPPDALTLILTILSEISLQADSFEANTPELVQLAQHSPTYLELPADRQAFFASVMTMPVFFYEVPLSPEEARQWEKEDKK